jgi:hypothetical protein
MRPVNEPAPKAPLFRRHRFFHDSDARLNSATKADETALVTAGYKITWPPNQRTGEREAAADRRVPRDIVDLLTIHENILPLGAVIAAAVGRFPGTTPEEMLAEISRHSRFTAEEFEALATQQPADARSLHRRIYHMLDHAEGFIAKLSSEAVEVVFLAGGSPVQPDVDVLNRYQRHSGAPGGLWAVLGGHLTRHARTLQQQVAILILRLADLREAQFMSWLRESRGQI